MRLHIKVFLWFWLGVVVVSGTLIGLTELTHSRTQDDRLWQEKYGPRVDLWARQETHILRTKGSVALEAYVGSFQADPGVLNYMFDVSGHEVFDRKASTPVLTIVNALMQSSGWTQRVDPVERIIAERVIDANGNPYVVVVDFPEPSVLSRPLFERLSAVVSGRPTRASAVRLAAVVDHLNRNVPVARETRASMASTLTVLRDTIAELVRFQSLLIVYLQQVTPYVDTRDRDVAGLLRGLSGAINSVADELMKRSDAMLTRDRRHEMGLNDLEARLAALQKQLLAVQRGIAESNRT